MAMQKNMLLLGLLAMCLALGVVIAAGVDAWNGDGESTGTGVYAICAGALLLAITVGMKLYSRTDV